MRVKLAQLSVLFSALGLVLLLSACQPSDTDEKPFNALALEKQPSEEKLDAESADQDIAGVTINKFKPVPDDANFRTVEWIDLLPKDDLDALLNPPDYLNEIQDGSAEDAIDSNLGNEIEEPLDRYQQALISQRIIPEMDGQAIRIPGFIVPLEFDDNHNITLFFLVPFFGACIHLPPPPPNQIIYVEYPEGLQIDSTYIPYWISGEVNTTITENDLATSAYTMKMQYVEDYHVEY